MGNLEECWPMASKLSINPQNTPNTLLLILSARGKVVGLLVDEIVGLLFGVCVGCVGGFDEGPGVAVGVGEGVAVGV